MNDIITPNEIRIAESIKNNREHVETTVLSTDERVIARVTDGIYRQPGSALRELISNAYDADATKIIIRTDEPRFNTMTIEDNGHGMSPEALSYIIHHIGGSAKRNEIGLRNGVTNSSDYNLTPNGRKLIGKIGIGLFSVAQLTQSFQIITKRKGDNYRSIANVALTQFSEKSNKISEKNKSSTFKSGTVKLWTENAEDTEYQGTTIILNKIRPQTKETLKSNRIWEAVFSSRQEFEENGATPIDPPKYHIGIMENEHYLKYIDNESRSLPWEPSDEPDEAFKKLVHCVWKNKENSVGNTRVSELFDYYLKMIWDISLSIPAQYVEKSLFETPFDNQFYPYKLSNSPKGQAAPINIKVGDKLAYEIEDYDEELQDFNVYIDNLKLSRPLLFDKLPITNHAIDKPMVFVGSYHEKFEGKPVEFTAGPLKFHAYLFWNSKISPVEHQGSMIRIHNASGTLFDETFMKYQIQELTRKRQVTCEIFIQEGLDSALNIDRESFNFSHPHVIILTRWLHNSFRQLTNANKSLAKKLRTSNKDVKKAVFKGQIDNIVNKAWFTAGNDEFQKPPTVRIIDDEYNKPSSNDNNSILLNLNRGNAAEISNNKLFNKSKDINPISSEKLKAITSILASYGLLESMSEVRRNEMIYSIYEIIVAED